MRDRLVEEIAAPSGRVRMKADQNNSGLEMRVV